MAHHRQRLQWTRGLLVRELLTRLWQRELLQTGRADWLRRLWGPRCLTALAYHRIANAARPDFDTYRDNVSATPANFAAQLDFLQRQYQVVSLAEVVAWLEHGRTLPPYPALITFDDGYADNFTAALPALRARRLPAVLFLTTGHIGHNRPFFWDLAAYCFHHTPYQEANLPGCGQVRWADGAGKMQQLDAWLKWLKTVPDTAKWLAVEKLPALLDVQVEDKAFAGLYLTWGQVGEMANAGIAFGAHTHTHPILTRVPLVQARHEACLSRDQLQARLGHAITTFAFPNGQAADYNISLQQMLRQSGFQMAFTLLPGPNRLRQMRRHPLAVRRVLIHHRDTLPRFAGKLMGLTRLLNWPR